METSSVITLIVLLVIVVGVIFRVVFWPGIRLRRIQSRPFPPQWQQILEKQFGLFNSLPQELQEQLKQLIKIFIADKKFIGCGGQQIDDEIRITISAQACLLMLNRPGNLYQHLQSILVYPTTFIATRQVRDELGLVSTSHSALLGESWNQGKVILAWDNVEKGARNLKDGHNVVLHEFAHQLDSESGAANGAPILLRKGAYQSWAHIFSEEFEQLQLETSNNKSTLMDSYGATNPAEFFAVATETFFERPREMASKHKELYRELAQFYRIDPRDWD